MNSDDPLKILIVEDESSIAKLCVRVFEMEGFISAVASDGRQGQEMIGKDTYDLILMDIRLPRINGLQVYEWILANYPEKKHKVAFMTGSVMGESLLRQLEETGRPFLLKPFGGTDLKDFVSGVLSGK